MSAKKIREAIRRRRQERDMERLANAPLLKERMRLVARDVAEQMQRMGMPPFDTTPDTVPTCGGEER